MKTRSTPASLSFKGQAAEHTTVKWLIGHGRHKKHFAIVSDGEIKKPWALSYHIPAAEKGLFTKYEIWYNMDMTVTGIRQPVDLSVQVNEGFELSE